MTAPAAGTYTVNAGGKNPSRSWESTSAVINVTGVDEKLIGLSPAEFTRTISQTSPILLIHLQKSVMQFLKQHLQQLGYIR